MADFSTAIAVANISELKATVATDLLIRKVTSIDDNFVFADSFYVFKAGATYPEALPGIVADSLNSGRWIMFPNPVILAAGDATGTASLPGITWINTSNGKRFFSNPDLTWTAIASGSSSVTTVTTTAYTQPSIGGTVTLNVEDSSMFAVGQYLYIVGGGTYELTAKPGATQLTVKNIGGGNAAPATVIGIGALITSTGRPQSYDNLKIVERKTDFPAPSGGVITLPSGSAWLISGTVDLTGDRLVCSGDCSIKGTSQNTASLVSTGLTGTALITTTGSLICSDLAITANTVFSATGTATKVVELDSVNLINCPNIGTIGGYGAFVAEGVGSSGSSGLIFDGTIGSIVIEGSVFIGATGTIISIPSSATISTRIRIERTLFSVTSPAIALNVSASATIPNSAFILSHCNFTDTGTYLGGLTHTSTKSVFESNIGIVNSAAIGSLFMQGNATATTIGATNTPVKAAGTTTGSELNQSFTHSNNRLTYAGVITRVFKADATVNLSSGNNNNIGVTIAKNGTPLDESRITITTSGTGSAQSIAIQCLVSMATDDYIEIWVRNNTATTAITVSDLNLMATPA